MVLGFVDNADDCDDEDPTFQSYQLFDDLDGDGYGDEGSPTTGCLQDPTKATNGDDCDDDDVDVGMSSIIHKPRLSTDGDDDGVTRVTPSREIVEPGGTSSKMMQPPPLLALRLLLPTTSAARMVTTNFMRHFTSRQMNCTYENGGKKGLGEEKDTWH